MDEISPYYKLKILFVGAISVGKTSFVHLLTHDKHEPNNESTIGLAFSTTRVELQEYPLSNPSSLPQFYWEERFNRKNIIWQDGEETLHPVQLIRLQLWDCAGSMRYRSFLNSYMRDVDICFLCFDLTNRESFQELNSWRNEVLKNYQGLYQPIFVIIGNKADLMAKGEINDPIKKFCCTISSEEIKTYCELWSCRYYCISCIQENSDKKVKKILYDTVKKYHEDLLLFKHLNKSLPQHVIFSAYHKKSSDILKLEEDTTPKNNKFNNCCYK